MLAAIVLPKGTKITLVQKGIFAQANKPAKTWSIKSVDFALRSADDSEIRFSRIDGTTTNTVLRQISCFGEDLRVKDLERALPVSVEIVDPRS